MELEQLRAALIAVINHYGQTISIGTINYVVKDVAHEVETTYKDWLEKRRAAEAQVSGAEQPNPAEKVEGEIIE